MRTRNALLFGTAVILLLAYSQRDTLEQRARLAVGGAAGKAAVSAMGELTSNANSRGLAAAELITLPIEVDEVAPGIFRASGVGNTYVITTSAGNVVFDTGLVIQAAEQREKLQALVGLSAPKKIIVSHSHADHVGGVRFWDDGSAELVAHEEFLEEQRYLTELDPYLHQRNRVLFPWLPEKPARIPGMNFRGLTPGVLVDNDEPYRFSLGGRDFEVLAVPGAEGADNLVLWLPQDRILLSGDFFGPQFPQFPNIFTMRGEKTRKPIEYIASLEQIIALKPTMVLPSHLSPATGDAVLSDIERIRDAVRFVHDATIAGMNNGKTVGQLMREVQLPPELALSQTHGKVSWAVKSIWEYYATWFHFDRTSELYATDQSEVLADLADSLDVESALDTADNYLAAQDFEKALLLSELLEGSTEHTERRVGLRRQSLNGLLDRARSNEHNDYEIYWLEAELSKLPN